MTYSLFDVPYHSYELPKMVRLSHNLFAACFSLMKLMPAKYILEKARQQKLIDANTTIIESTSGTFGLGLAMVCNQMGLKLILVSDPVIDPYLKNRLSDLGCTLAIVEDLNHPLGIQQARLLKLEELKKQIPNHFWPCQYHNPQNQQAYITFAELIASTLGNIDCLVGPVGSGGSMCGTTHILREMNPQLQAIAVDTHGSVLFGDRDKPRLLRGLGNSLLPKNLDHTLFDEVHWLSAAEAFAATRKLHRQYSLYMGPTSGASFLVAEWYAHMNPDAKVLAIFPDDGFRYAYSVYDDQWLIENNLLLPSLRSPHLIHHMDEKDQLWTRMQWHRQPLMALQHTQISATAEVIL